MSQEERWRVFCAVELPPEARARVFAHIAALRESFPKARASWARAEALHVTLKFLGEIERARVEALSEASSRAAASAQSFELHIAETGAFPPRGPARVLWLGVRDASGGLARLQQTLEAECAHAGFAREPRDFHPHLTVARVRAPNESRALAEAHRARVFDSLAFKVQELFVIRSELGAGGSRYTPVSRHELNSA
jgi:2'-5' RNA ligase